MFNSSYLNYRSASGAGTGKRVKWPGYHIITNPAEAMPFTVAELIQGGSWLSSTGVTFVQGLVE